MTNEQLLEVRKAAITAVDDLAAGGKLNPVQADRFIDYVIDVTELSGAVRTVRFRAEEMNIDKIGVGRRVTVPKVEARDPGRRFGIRTSKVSLRPVEVMTPFEISDNFAENSIEGEAVEDTIVRLMARQAANDYEELMINGDLLGYATLESDLVDGGSSTKVIKDSFLALFDGWLRKLDGANIYNANGANLSTKIFSGMIKSMPVKFRRSRRNLRFLLALDLEQNWREKVSSRATAQGDRSLMSSDAIPVFGVPMVAIPLLEAEPPVVEHKTLGAYPSTVSLRYAPISETLPVYVTTQTLGNTPETPYVETTDYVLDRVAGTITNTVGGALAAGGNVKITYRSQGQVVLCDSNNLILAIGRDVRIETDRDIFASVNQFAITTKIDVAIEEVTAAVKGINIGLE